MRHEQRNGIDGLWLEGNEFADLLALMGLSDLAEAADAMEAELKRIDEQASRAAAAAARRRLAQAETGYRGYGELRGQWEQEFQAAMARRYAPGGPAHLLALGSYNMAQQGYALKNAGLGNMVTINMGACMRMYRPGPGVMRR